MSEKDERVYNKEEVLDEDVLIGIMLGDAWIENRKKNGRLRFEQSHIRTEIFYYVYNNFVEYTTSAYPRLRERYDKRTQKVYKSWHFSTKASPKFSYYHGLFYKDGKKIIPREIDKYLTPKSLAFFIMCDGHKYNTSVALATNGFTIEDNKLLMEALNRKFGFESWVVNKNRMPTIYIPKRNLLLLQEMVKPHMHDTLLYKIHL